MTGLNADRRWSPTLPEPRIAAMVSTIVCCKDNNPPERSAREGARRVGPTLSKVESGVEKACLLFGWTSGSEDHVADVPDTSVVRCLGSRVPLDPLCAVRLTNDALGG